MLHHWPQQSSSPHVLVSALPSLGLKVFPAPGMLRERFAKISREQTIRRL